MHNLNTAFKMTFYILIFFFISCEKENSELLGINLSLKQQIAQKILVKTNAIREKQGLSGLQQNDDMDELAQLHSVNMVTYDFFDHVDHENKSPSDRADDLSFGWSSIAENIGFVPWFENVTGCGDTRSAEAISQCVVEGWRNSPGHYANMIGDFNELGIGVSFTKDSIAYFTQVFRIP